MEPLRQACEQAVRALPGVTSVHGRADRRARAAAAAPAAGAAAGARRASRGQAAAGAWCRASARSSPSPRARAASASRPPRSIWPWALAAIGQRVGLLDADIYGPSLPRMLGITGRPVTAADGKKLRPMESYGVKVMSMGFLVDEDAPMIWRGPMVQSALAADAGRRRLGRARRAGGRPAARHRRRAADHGAAGAAGRRGDRARRRRTSRCSTRARRSTCSARSTCRCSASSRT